jgi:hypothetical protein
VWVVEVWQESDATLESLYSLKHRSYIFVYKLLGYRFSLSTNKIIQIAGFFSI